jgi:oxygen-independent coproporphyrinogen-3 oxidase
LPADVAEHIVDRDFGIYVHVPFCATRCGYCDFNTYTADELSGTSQSDYIRAANSEIALAGRVLPQAPKLGTVFFGGGTPTLLLASEHVRLLQALASTFGLRSGAEITTEANPESVDSESLAVLRTGGINRISMGMQSAVPHVLKTLDRTHTPGRVTAAVAEARAEGFDNLSLDLIYGTPGESLADWRRSLDAAIELEPDHISAYSLIVEKGTRLARQIRSGDLEAPDDDVQAVKYELADELLSAAGYQWYEVSNWAKAESYRSRHNVGYWTGDNWWGIGPGAHSHVAGVRWWNVKHPRAYAQRLTAGQTPAADREVLDQPTRRLEQVMLQVRMREGLPRELLSAAAMESAVALVDDGLLDGSRWAAGYVSLTRRGRLLADLVVRQLTG